MNIREIHQLYDGLGRILELAEKNQEISSDATREMHSAIRNIEQTTQQLKGQIRKDGSAQQVRIFLTKARCSELRGLDNLVV